MTAFYRAFEKKAQEDLPEFGDFLHPYSLLGLMRPYGTRNVSEIASDMPMESIVKRAPRTAQDWYSREEKRRKKRGIAAMSSQGGLL